MPIAFVIIKYMMKKHKDRHSISKLLYDITKFEGYKLEHFSYNIDSYGKRPGDFYAFKPKKKRLISNGSLDVSPTFFEAYFNHGISYPIAKKFIALSNRAKRLKCVFKSKKLLLEAYMRSKGIRTLPELELKLAMAGC